MYIQQRSQINKMIFLNNTLVVIYETIRRHCANKIPVMIGRKS